MDEMKTRHKKYRKLLLLLLSAILVFSLCAFRQSSTVKAAGGLPAEESANVEESGAAAEENVNVDENATEENANATEESANEEDGGAASEEDSNADENAMEENVNEEEGNVAAEENSNTDENATEESVSEEEDGVVAEENINVDGAASEEISMLAMPRGVAAAPSYAVSRVNKGTELNVLSTNFTSIAHGTAYPTISNYGGWAISDRSDIKKRMIHNPYSMFGDPTDSLTATWYHIGTINGQSVNAVLTLSGFSGALDAGDPFFGTNTHTILLGADFWEGVLFTHLHTFDAELSLYYASGAKIDLTGMYTTFGSLQGDQQNSGWLGFEGVRIN